MPTYGYRCTACETTFERIQKITDPPITECVECGSPVKKMIYPVGIQFKGSGFYVNDYAPKSGGESKPAADTSGESKAAAEKSSADKSSADSSGAAKSDVKAETKSDPPSSAPAAPAGPTTGT